MMKNKFLKLSWRPFRKGLPMLFMLSVLCLACQKDWLEEKRDNKMVVPSSLKDLRALMSNASNLFNNEYRGSAVALGEEYEVTPSVFTSLGEQDIRLYTWANDLFPAVTALPEWDGAYQQIFYTNVVLEGLQKLEPTEADRDEWNDVKGAALFQRARAMLNLALLFAPPYRDETADHLPGIPLRLVSDIQMPVSRSSLSESYQQIVADLKEASGLLRVQNTYKTDPTKAAAWGLLARCLLLMNDYGQAAQMADSCLRLQHELMDFNDLQLDPKLAYPIPLYNEEVIFHSQLTPTYPVTLNSRANISNELMDLYGEDDLRRSVYFAKSVNGGTAFRGSHTGSLFYFGGVSTAEILLIRAECRARLGQLPDALADLDVLRSKRVRRDRYMPYSSENAEDVLTEILDERRKELLFRGLRWGDLRRLNQEVGKQRDLHRPTDKGEVVLPANDPRYTLLIPNYVVIRSGIQQNDR